MALIKKKTFLLVLGTSTCMTSSDIYRIPISVNSEIYKLKFLHLGKCRARGIEEERLEIWRAANITMLGNMRQIGNVPLGNIMVHYNNPWHVFYTTWPNHQARALKELRWSTRSMKLILRSHVEHCAKVRRSKWPHRQRTPGQYMGIYQQTVMGSCSNQQ